MQVAVRRLILIAGLSVVSLLLLFLLSRPTGLMNYIAGTRVPPLGDVLDPDTGVLNAQGLTADSAVTIPDLTGEVRVIRDTRGVPHIYAGSERDAVMALGYVTAQDRLFQLDFFPRVASGRLAEAFGPDMVGTDQFLRSTGMEWGAKKNFEQIRSEGGPVLDLLQWFSDGVNAYIDGLSEDELPIEFRLSGYRPNRWSPLQSLRTIQVLTYDLSFDGDSYEYGWLKALMNDEEYEKLFPRNAPLYVPVIPGYPVPDLVPDSLRPRGDVRRPAPPRLRRVLPSLAPATTSAEPRAFFEEAGELLARHEAEREALQGTAFEGYIAGKGSNNWAVHRGRSETGAPILANDMHLALNLPAIWYEVHMVTPDYNTYGNVMPGMPLPVVAFNDHLAWGYTNGTVDVIDHYALELDATGTQYRYNDGYRPIVTEIDTIYVNGGDAVIDTLKYAHWGPVIDAGELGAVAIQWTAHKPMRNIEALRDMHLAKSMDEFQDALRNWDVAPQNVLAASRDGEIAIRTSGHFPIRAAGDGIGLLDGTTSDYEWTGRIPFDELPSSRNPSQGYLASANQMQVGPAYRYYLGHDWPRSFRSLRINRLLSTKTSHSVDDLKRYQADVQTVQHELFRPMLDTLRGVTGMADTLRQVMLDWDGEASVDQPAAVVFDEFLDVLAYLTWDEFRDNNLRSPKLPVLYQLFATEPASRWMDLEETRLKRETANDLLALALEATADSVELKYGLDQKDWRWGDHHKALFRHLLRLKPFQRGPYEYPGFANTLSPAAGRPTTFSASWRMVVDFSGETPIGYGVYPGGQSGDPASPLYDAHLETFLNFQYYRLDRPGAPRLIAPEKRLHEVVLTP